MLSLHLLPVDNALMRVFLVLQLLSVTPIVKRTFLVKVPVVRVAILTSP